MLAQAGLPMTEDQYGNLMKAVGRIEAQLESGDKKFEVVQLNQINMSAKLDESNGGLKKHLDRHRTGGKIFTWGAVLSGIIGVLWEVLN